jgi:hypothetical protein
MSVLSSALRKAKYNAWSAIVRPSPPSLAGYGSHVPTLMRIPGEGEKDSGVNVKTIPG